MTIAAAYLTSGGVVIGADSTTTVMVSGNNGVAQVLNHAQKVFEVGQGGRLAACTWGAGGFGKISHRTILARVGDWVGEKSIEDAANHLRDSVQDAAKNCGLTGSVGYFIGGRETDTRNPKCFKVEVVPHQDAQVSELQIGEPQFAGCPQVFNRVFRGFDPGLPGHLWNELQNRLKGSITDQAQLAEVQKAFIESIQAVSRLFAVTGFRDLPIREAIDFVYAYLHITIKAFKFRYGAPPCGGPIEIGFVTTDRNFRWATHKPFETAIADHAPLIGRH